MKKLQEKLQARAKGFTLVELIVVVIIIGILAAIAIPRMMDVRQTAQNGADEATARTIISMAVTASMDFGGDLTKVSDPKFIKKINDAVDVTVVAGSSPKDGEWGIEYSNAIDTTKYPTPAGGSAQQTLKVYKKGFTSSNGAWSGTAGLVYEK